MYHKQYSTGKKKSRVKFKIKKNNLGHKEMLKCGCNYIEVTTDFQSKLLIHALKFNLTYKKAVSSLLTHPRSRGYKMQSKI